MLKKLLSKDNKLRTLWICVLGVAVLHLVVLLLFGSLVIFRHLFDREIAFEPPAEIEKRMEPRKLEHKVKIQKQQQKSGRPKIQPRLSAKRVSEFALPEIKADPKPVTELLKTDLKSFGASGFGTGLAGGRGAGGLGIGTSQVMFMGIRTQTDRIAILLDMSPSMLEDQRGAFAGYTALKDEVSEVITMLSPGSFFNVIGYARGVDTFRPVAEVARKETKQAAIEWIKPYMTDTQNVANNGTRENNFQLEEGAPLIGPTAHGPTRFDLAIAAAFQSGVDTIIVVSDGHHNISRQPTAEEQKAGAERREAFMANVSKGQLERMEKERARRIAERNEANAKRREKGLADKVTEGGGIGLGIPGGINTKYGDQAVLDYIEKLAVHFYDNKDLARPKIYVIAYVPSGGGEGFMKELTKRFKGRYRPTRALAKPVRL